MKKLALLVLLLLLFGGGYLFLSSGKGKSINLADLVAQLNPNKTPFQKLDSALSKTVGVKTLYVDFNMEDTGLITLVSKGVTQTIQANVSGYISGSTDGKTQKMELNISSPSNPGVSIVISVMSLEDGTWFVKSPTTAGKWQKYTKEEYEKESAGNSLDASLYGLNILASVFDESKALFKTIQKETVESLPSETVEGKTYDKYSAEISIPDFISALPLSSNVTEKDVSDSKIILKDAVMRVTLSVDRSTNYVTKIVIDAKHLTFIPNDESEKMGVSTVYDIVTTADLSRFDVPTNISAPDPSEVISNTF